jgi:uncharacterized protein YndB with AHSA1/START domain
MTTALAVLVACCWAVRAQDAGPIVCEGVVDAPLDSVWAAWATGGGLRSWLAPHAEIDLRLGGLMRANYNPAGTLGDAGTIENTILSFEPRKMLSIKVAKTPDKFPFPLAIRQMWTVIYFERLDKSRTRVRIVGLGFQTDDESQKMRVFFDRGNAMTLTALQRRFSPAGR